MRLYLDCCCYNRPFDNPTNNRIYDEGEAVLSILSRSLKGESVVIGSFVLDMEIDNIPDYVKKFNVQSLYRVSSEFISQTPDIRKRAEELRSKTGIRLMDSLHLASAEAGRTDIFITTDDRLIRSCGDAELFIRVMNPVKYLAEVIEND